MIGLFCVDPGKATGVAWGVIDEREQLAVDAVAARELSESITVGGDPMTQVRQIWHAWEGFRSDCWIHFGIRSERVQLVFEDFVLSPQPGSMGREITMPERVSWAFEGYKNGRHDTYRMVMYITPIVWQMPSAANRFKERAILEKANAWIRGREHERSAFSHMILRVNNIMDTYIARG